MQSIRQIIEQDNFGHAELVQLLHAKGEDRQLIFSRAAEVKLAEVGRKVYFRGLVEMSNVCNKDCFYCGIRHSNNAITRYTLSDEEILHAAKLCHTQKYGSMVLQSGEITSSAFTNRIARLLKAIKKISNNELGITLSLGEQSESVYKRWFDAGAHRYLLRIETSDRDLYRKLHPDDHDFDTRLNCIKNLQHIGYQTGTGVMIGLPFQTVDHLAGDLLFMQEMNIDMVGMGPYIEHSETPLFRHRESLWSLDERFDMTLKMIAILRIMMKDINIAATTALQAIDPLGREKAIRIGANIIMPNITPGRYRNDYALYQNKPCVDEEPEDCMGCLDARLALADSDIGYGAWGDSPHFKHRQKS